MEIFLRFLQAIITFIFFFVNKLLEAFLPRTSKPTIPPINNVLLLVPLIELAVAMRQRKLTSLDLVGAYIARIKDVNPHINAIVEDRFEDALQDARHVDALIAIANQKELYTLFLSYPLLGIPFTVKESCAVKDMSFVVGSLQRRGCKATKNGAAVQSLREAGAIPLLVSTNPEFCFSIETNSFTDGPCFNPYDKRRSAGGSSGGEGALNGAGASLFGIGSDIAGSIRIPSLFNGVFGHKPTGGLISVEGHFPGSSDPDFGMYMQIGPITRFAKDMPMLLNIMAGKNAPLLDLFTPIKILNVTIHYAFGFHGFNGLLHQAVDPHIKHAMVKALKHFRQRGATIAHAHINGFRNSTEIALSAIVRLEDFPYLINSNSWFKVWETIKEYIKSVYRKSDYTRDALIFELMRRTNSFMPRRNLRKYKTEADALKAEIIQLLGNDGVLFFPTFHVSAIHHGSSVLPLWGIDYSLLFNVLGLPATHVPLGLNPIGLPVGFQIIAAPYKDKLCLQIAAMLEHAFTCWIPARPHQFIRGRS